MEIPPPPPPSLLPPMSDSPRRSSSCSSSPDFEFWRLTNPSSVPQPDLLSADELFVDGVLLPLHLLHPTKPKPEPEPEPKREPACDPPPAPANPASILAAPAAPSSGSKRWKDIFRVGKPSVDEKDKETKKPKERKGTTAAAGSGSGSGSAEQLNINIWPFSRSRSAGSGAGSGGRPRPSSARKVSSAPCSRSNSRGESSKPPAPSAGRKWAASPGRAGVSGGIHLGRTSPVWQVNRKAGKAAEQAPAAARVGPRDRMLGGVRVLNLNVNACIGYRNQVSCRGEDKDGVNAGDRTGDGGGGGGGGPGGGNGGLFGFRGLFSKKVY